MNTRNRNQSGIVSQFQAKRFRQELANAQQKLEEYEILIASLYETLENIQSIACDKCRVKFEELTPADSATTPTAVMHQPTTLPRPRSDSRSESGESYRRNVLRADTRPHSPNLTVTSLVDEPSRRRTATPSSAVSSREIHAEPNSTSSASSNDGEQTNHAPSRSSSASNHELQAPLLSIGDEPDGWSIAFNTSVKRSICVKLVDMLEYKEAVSCVRFSPDGNYLAVGLDNGQTYIHNMELGKKGCILAELSSTNLPPERDRIWSMSFSPDGKYLATGHGSSIIRVWDIAKKHVRNVFRHRGGVSGVDFSTDGRFVVSAAHDGTVCVWSMRDGSPRIYSINDCPYYSLKLTPDGRYVTAVDYNGQLTISDYRTSQEVRWRCHDGCATIAFMPDGTGLVTGSLDSKVKYWDLSFLGEIQEGDPKETLNFIGHTNGVRAVTILADGPWVISASDDLTLCIWDSQTADRQCTIKGHENQIWWVDANPTGHYFASGGYDNRVAIWRCDSI